MVKEQSPGTTYDRKPSYYSHKGSESDCSKKRMTLVRMGREGPVEVYYLRDR